MQKWQKNRTQLHRTAHATFDECVRISNKQGPGIIRDARATVNEDPENRSVVREIVGQYFTLLPKESIELGNIHIVHGLCGSHEHGWLIVESRPELVHPHDAEIAVVEQDGQQRPTAYASHRYIIELNALEVSPPLLLISPLSPWQRFYHEQERYDHPPLPPEIPDYVLEARERSEKILKDLGLR